MSDTEPKPDSGADIDHGSGDVHHIADEPVKELETNEPTLHSPITETGLPVAEQIRKEWDPNKDGGLPTPLHPIRR